MMTNAIFVNFVVVVYVSLLLLLFIVVAHIGGRKPKDLGLIEQSDHHVAQLLGCSTTMLPHYHASVHLPCNLLHRV